MRRKVFGFNELKNSDLIVDAIYKGGTFGDVRDDPLSKLMGCGNQGGFRIVGDSRISNYKLAVLYSSLDDPDWPDFSNMSHNMSHHIPKSVPQHVPHVPLCGICQNHGGQSQNYASKRMLKQHTPVPTKIQPKLVAKPQPLIGVGCPTFFIHTYLV